VDQAYDLVVVGGGIAGLVAAANAGGEGRRVLLLEAAPDLGGRARTRSSGGFHFNQGAHALYRQGRFKAALDRLGVPYTGGEPVAAQRTLMWDGMQHPFPSSLGKVIGLSPLGFGERLQLVRLFQQVGAGDYPREGVLRDFTGALTPKLRHLIEALVRLAAYANAPEQLALGPALDQLRMSIGGVIYVDGGWATLVAGLEAALRQRAVEIRTSTRLETLARTGDEWRLALAEDEAITARAVVLATEPDVAGKLAGASIDAERLVAAAEPVRAVCLDVGLSRLPTPTTGLVLGADEPLYLAVHSKAGSLAPEGGALVHTACYLAPGEAPTPAHLQRLELMLDQVQPSWRALEVERQRLTGIAVVQDLHEAGRPRAAVATDAPGLFLAGDWVGEGAMLSDAAAKSGEEAAAAALAYLSQT